MTSVLSTWNPYINVAVGIVALVAAVKLWKSVTRRQTTGKESKYKHGVVYLHMFPRNFSKKIVNLSPYGMKVETWCRMNKIPFEVVETVEFSPKEGHIPWIVYNGQILADSSLIIEFLQNEFDCDDHLTDFQKAITRTISRMMDDSFSLLYAYYRYYMKPHEFYKYCRIKLAPSFMHYFVLKLIGRKVRNRCLVNGFARYGDEHVINLGLKDIQSLDGILADKLYMLGDTATTVDATVFAHLSQVLYPDMSYPWKDYIKKEHPRLLDYCNRIKEKYWPDWDSLVEHDTFM